MWKKRKEKKKRVERRKSSAQIALGENVRERERERDRERELESILKQCSLTPSMQMHVLFAHCKWMKRKTWVKEKKCIRKLHNITIGIKLIHF